MSLAMRDLWHAGAEALPPRSTTAAVKLAADGLPYPRTPDPPALFLHGLRSPQIRHDHDAASIRDHWPPPMESYSMGEPAGAHSDPPPVNGDTGIQMPPQTETRVARVDRCWYRLPIRPYPYVRCDESTSPSADLAASLAASRQHRLRRRHHHHHQEQQDGGDSLEAWFEEKEDDLESGSDPYTDLMMSDDGSDDDDDDDGARYRRDRKPKRKRVTPQHHRSAPKRRIDELDRELRRTRTTTNLPPHLMPHLLTWQWPDLVSSHGGSGDAISKAAADLADKEGQQPWLRQVYGVPLFVLEDLGVLTASIPTVLKQVCRVMGLEHLSVATAAALFMPPIDHQVWSGTVRRSITDQVAGRGYRLPGNQCAELVKRCGHEIASNRYHYKRMSARVKQDLIQRARLAIEAVPAYSEPLQDLLIDLDPTRAPFGRGCHARPGKRSGWRHRVVPAFMIPLLLMDNMPGGGGRRASLVSVFRRVAGAMQKMAETTKDQAGILSSHRESLEIQRQADLVSDVVAAFQSPIQRLADLVARLRPGAMDGDDDGGHLFDTWKEANALVSVLVRGAQNGVKDV